MIRNVRWLLLISLFVLAMSKASADPDVEPANDPLPDGAKVRFGTTRPILRTAPSVALVPPTFKTFLAPTITGGVRAYDLGTGRPVAKLGPLLSAGRVVVSANGKRAAVARPANLSVVDVATGKTLLVLQSTENALIVGTPGVSLSADGTVLAYCGHGKNGKGWAVVWDLDKNEIITEIETSMAAPIFPTLSADGKTLVTHGPPLPAPKNPIPDGMIPTAPAPVKPPESSRSAQVWEVASGKELFQAHVTGMGGMVVAAAFSPDGGTLALSAGDGPVDLWDVKSGKRTRTLLGRKGQGARVAISPDGKTVATVGPDFRIERWKSDGTPLGVTMPPPGLQVAQITGLEFADNERVIAWMTASLFAIAWEAPSGKLLSPVTDHISALRSISFAEDGKDLFTSGADGKVIRWDLATGLPNEEITLRPPRLPGQPLVRPVVTLSADAKRAARLSNPAEIYSVETGDDLFCVPAPSSPLAPVTSILSADGMKLVTISRQAGNKRTGSCVVWDLDRMERIAEFDVPASATPTAPGGGISPDGTRLLVAVQIPKPGGVAFLSYVGYDLKTGKKLGEVEDNLASGNIHITVVDQSRAIVSSSTGRVVVVDYEAGKIGKTIDKLPTRGELAVGTKVVVSPDGKLFATGMVGDKQETYAVRVYEWPSGKVLHTFQGHLGHVTAIRFSPDSKFLATGSQDTSVYLWDLSKLPTDK